MKPLFIKAFLVSSILMGCSTATQVSDVQSSANTVNKATANVQTVKESEALLLAKWTFAVALLTVLAEDCTSLTCVAV